MKTNLDLNWRKTRRTIIERLLFESYQCNKTPSPRFILIYFWSTTQSLIHYAYCILANYEQFFSRLRLEKLEWRPTIQTNLEV